MQITIVVMNNRTTAPADSNTLPKTERSHPDAAYLRRPKVGISKCMLGEKVRYDGGHKADRFVRDTLGEYIDFVPVCPELEMGLSIPREPIRLERHNDAILLVAPGSGTDHTTQMVNYTEQRLKTLQAENLSGYIVQKKSPSCGMERVKVYSPDNPMPDHNGTGLFTAALMRAFPELPIEENGRLNDPVLRDNFIERIFAYQRIGQFFESDWRVGDLVAFHSDEKYLLLAHDETIYRELGRLVAHASQMPTQEIARAYPAMFMNGMKKIATAAKHTNVLQHIAGYFKKSLDSNDRAEIQEIISRYHAGQVPLIVPITLLQHHIRKQNQTYLINQTYLNPHPQELMLRNHV